MSRMLISLIVGLLLGAVITFFVVPRETPVSFGSAVERDDDYVPVISMAEVEVHREDSYESIETIDAVFALPTDFARSEALYVMAGREDTFGVHELIDQAIGITSPEDRRSAIGILLERLTELDPYDALETARQYPLASNPDFESGIWRAWGRLDLEHALTAAENGTRLERNNAAQALYSSVRNFDAATFAQIESALGIGPDSGIRAKQIYALAAESPAAAIAFIESQGSHNEQREQIAILARYLMRLDMSQHQGFVDLVSSDYNRQALQQYLASYGAVADPASALADFEREPANSRYQMQAYNALQTLSREDPEAAIQYVENLTDRNSRRRLIAIVAQGVAAEDPQRALAWAAEFSTGAERSSATMAAIAQIAQTDPQLAVSEARSIDNPSIRNRAMQSAIAVAAQRDPIGSVELLSYVTDEDTRYALLGQVAQTWGQRDFDSATQWIATLGTDEQRVAIQGMAQRFVRQDVGRAIALDQQFPDSASSGLRSQIASSLVQQQSVEAANAYISQYKGTPEYSRLQVSTISAVAQSDPDKAMRMIDGIEEKEYRDQLISGVIARKANDDPRLAMQWAEGISDAAVRQQALGQVATVWSRNDPDQAEAWLQGLPRGATRDSAIVALTSGQNRVDSNSLELINTIDDKAKRKQATAMYVQRVAYMRPGEAERILATMELSDTERRQFQRFIDQVYNNSIHMD